MDALGLCVADLDQPAAAIMDMISRQGRSYYVCRAGGNARMQYIRPIDQL
jgi:hypothetical protein